MKNKKGKKKNVLQSKEALLGVALVAIILVCVITVVVTRGNKSNKDDEKTPAGTDIKEDQKDFTEKDLSDIYGMSGKEAIEIVKKDFKSDTFDFSVEVDQDSNYIVIAKNKITETEYRYSVDPSNGSYYAID